MPIKLVAVDIDRTLIDDNMKVPAENITAVQKAVEQGCHVVIVSGRMGPSVRRYMHILGIEDLVPSLGGSVIEKWDGSVVYQKGITPKDAVVIYDIARKYNQYPLAFCNNDWLADEENIYWADSEFRATGINGIILDLREKLSQTGSSKLLIPSLDQGALDLIINEIREKLGDSIACFRSSPSYLEVMPKGINKGSVIDFLIDYFNIKREETMAIGDYYNDIDMFNSAGFCATVDNAPDDIKKLVDYVCPFDNNHSAVGKIINKFVLV